MNRDAGQSTRPVSLTLLYRSTLAVLCIAGFYSGLLNYLSTSGVSPVQPAVWIVLLMILALPFVLDQRCLAAVAASPLLWWCGLYAVMTIVWFMGSSQS